MADEILPSPDLLQQYEALQKGSSKKLVDAFIQENEHRRVLEKRTLEGRLESEKERLELERRSLEGRLELEKQSLEGQLEYAKRGQLFGLIIGLTAIVAGATAAALGAQWSGAIIGGGGVIGLVSVFVIGRNRPPTVDGPDRRLP